MKRHFAISFAFLSICALCASALGAAPGKLVPEADANAAGLTRAWFAQTTLVQGREWVTSATFQDGVLFVTTDGGRLQAFDGETGNTLWSVNVGSGLLLQPAVNSKLVAAICGTNLIVYDRFTGKKLEETRLYGNPSAAPTMSEREIYVPCFSERVLAYQILPEDQEFDRLSTTVNSMVSQSEGLGNAAGYWAQKFQEQRDNLAKSSYAIKDLDDRRPYPCAAFGIPLVAPIVGTQSYSNDYIGWSTNNGWLVFGKMVRNAANNPFSLYVKFQVRPNFSYVNESRIGNKVLIPRDDVQSSPFFMAQDLSIQNMAVRPENRQGGLFIIGSESGYVYALNDVTGELRWTYLTRTGVSERIAAFGKSVYIPTESGDFFSVNVETGYENWNTKNVAKMIAASDNRLYVADTLGRVVSIDRANGNRDKVLNVGLVDYKVFNRENDRIYLVSKDGVVQCLHETLLEEPIKHRESCQEIYNRIMAESADDAPKPEVRRQPAVVEEVEDDFDVVDPDDDPFGDFDDEDDAFAAPATPATPATPAEPAEEEDDDPFGFLDEDDPFGGDF
ncbi:MAG: PQQ-binding-like beta-propeller repeat protein [Thermoguttaceae bacterium]|nr:PQQ-binding-like beta-propeller repeat protein [Thermoguttaceae bacterium]